jgi:gas vesicle protein
MGQGTPLEVGVLFGFGGTPKTQGQLAKEEFNAGFDHIMQAAQYAAGGMGSAMGPRVHNVRSMVSPAAGRVRTAASSRWDSTRSTLAPIMAAAREGAREATEAALKARAKETTEVQRRLMRGEQVNRKRMGLAVGLLAAGVAVGAAAALLVRRRRRSAWEDYDPSEALESMMDSAGEKPSDMRRRAAGVKDKSAEMAADVRAKGAEMSQKTAEAVQKAVDKTADAIEKTGDKTSAAMNKAADKANEAAQKSGDQFADTSERMR